MRGVGRECIDRECLPGVLIWINNSQEAPPVSGFQCCVEKMCCAFVLRGCVESLRGEDVLVRGAGRMY